MERTDNTLHTASGADPLGAFLEPFQAVRNRVISFYKTNFKTSRSSASPDVLMLPLKTTGKRLHPWDGEDHFSLP